MLAAVKTVLRRLVSASGNSFSGALALSFLLHLIVLGVSLTADFKGGYPPALTVSLAKIPAPEKQKLDRAPLMAVTPPSEEGSASSAPNNSNIVEITKPRLDRGVVLTGDYFPADLVSAPPVLTNPEWLEDAAWRLPASVSGEVLLRIYIGVDGRVEDVRVDGDAAGELAEWLTENIRSHAEFSAARQNGYPVKSVLKIKLRLGAVAHH